MIHTISNFRSGIKIVLDNEPYEVESSEFVKPGKGHAFVRVKLRRLLMGTRIEKTFKSTESIKTADIVEIKLTYLYNDGDFWYFMDCKTFEQLTINEKVIGNNSKWLLNQTECVVTLWNNHPIGISIPTFVEMKIIDTNPYIKKDAITNGTKTAILATGVEVKVPQFLQNGEIIKVDTRSGEYVSRVK